MWRAEHKGCPQLRVSGKAGWDGVMPLFLRQGQPCAHLGASHCGTAIGRCHNPLEEEVPPKAGALGNSHDNLQLNPLGTAAFALKMYRAHPSHLLVIFLPARPLSSWW